MTHAQKEKRNKEIIDLFELGIVKKDRKTVIKFLALTYNLSTKQVRNILQNYGK